MGEGPGVDDVDPNAEEASQLSCELVQLSEVGEADQLSFRVHVYEEIDVARGVGVATSHRADDAEIAGMVAIGDRQDLAAEATESVHGVGKGGDCHSTRL